MNKIKVLVVDNSIFMRKTIDGILSKEQDIEIVGFAKNGQEAVNMTENLSPDVITMAVEMPTIDGVTVLEIIMKNNPTPVIVISQLTKEGADAILKALNLGALDFISKNNHYSGGIELEKNLADKIRKCALNKHRVINIHNNKNNNILDLFQKTSISSQTKPQTKTLEKSNQKINNQEINHCDTYDYVPIPFNRDTDTKSNLHNDVKRIVINQTGAKKVVAIGASTGGPQSLQKVIPLLPENIGVPIVVTQHMPKNFTQSFVARLNHLSKLKVIEVTGEERLMANVVYMAPGGYHLKFKKNGASVYTEIDTEPSDVFNTPSVDVMINSIISIYGKECLGVIMTGMGNDGYKSLNNLKNMGGTIIAQNEPTCIVYGMPKAVIEAGIADEIVPLDEIAARIIYHVK